ncbi:hypothetical protein JTE90_027510 [Oedothorax gibbosus]|uniref:Uncharacterized protein n=1 Tax=Oedothorax gibbosus TaxID=931172 RepID=A0AAV6TIW1_9ARAC|nr:hypothetical protein JTE90_027510 [Oedothorax gibbosus]
MIKRNRGGIRISPRGEILGPSQDELAKAFSKNVFINQERKLGIEGDRYRPSLTLNDARQRPGVPQMTRRAASGKPKLLGSGGKWLKAENKGIEEGTNKGLRFI